MTNLKGIDDRDIFVLYSMYSALVFGRAKLSDLKDKGIYFSKEEEAQHRLERSMMADALNKLFRHRPYR